LNEITIFYKIILRIDDSFSAELGSKIK